MNVKHPLLVFSDCVQKRFSGTLTFKSDKVRQFVFQEGVCVSALSNAKSELPGTFLNKEGKLSAPHYEAYLAEIHKPKTGLWDAALRVSGMSESELIPLRLKYIAQTAALAAASTAESQIQPVASPNAKKEGVHPLKLLMAAVSDLSGESLRKIVPDFSDTSSLTFNPAQEKALSPLPLAPEEKGLVTVVQNNNVVSEVFTSSYLGKDRIEKLFAVFVLSGLVTLVGAQAAAQMKHETSLDPERKKVADELRGKFNSLSLTTYYDWLGVPGNAKKEKIDEAATAWIERLSSNQIEGLFFGDEEGISSRLVESLREAQKVLSHVAQRAEYDGFLARGGKGSFVQTSTVGKEEEALGRIQTLKAAGNLSGALSAAGSSLSALPDSPLLLIEFAKISLEAFGATDSEKKERALAALKKALSLSPQRADAFEVLGRWMEAMGQKEKAVEAFKRALSIAPHASVAYEALQRLVPDHANAESLLGIARSLNRFNHYELLGVPNNAPVHDIQRAYRECTRRFHPDRFFKGDPATKDSANVVYKQMVKAYMTLKNSNKRKEYDYHLTKNLEEATRPPQTTVAATPPEEDPTEHSPTTSQGKKFYQLAITALKQGKKEAAKLNLQLALQIEPNSALLKKKLKELS